MFFFFFFQAEDGIRDFHVTGVQTCALPISISPAARDGDRARGWEGPAPRGAAPRPSDARRGTRRSRASAGAPAASRGRCASRPPPRSEEHTSELQSRENLVCRLL